MKTFLLSLVVTITSGFLLNSCSKKTGAPPAPEPIPEEIKPLQIEKTIFRRLRESEIIADTFYFKYDDKGRITSKSSTIFPAQIYTYTDDKITSVKSISHGDTTVLMSNARYSPNGDSILLDYTGPGWTGVGTDTFFQTYVIKDSIVTNLLSYGHDYIGTMYNAKENWIYNEQGNLVSNFKDPSPGSLTPGYEVIAWDDKINPLHGQPALNFAFLQTGLPLASFSVHNPITYKDSDNNLYEVEMTYNKQGYPISVKFRNEDFINTEIFYNE